MKRLVIRPGGIGDFVVGLPALRALCSGHTTELWIPRRFLSLVSFASSVRCIDGSGIFLLGFGGEGAPDLHERLASFDEVFTWYGANEPPVRHFLLTANSRTHFLRAVPPRNSPEPIAQYLAKQIQNFCPVSVGRGLGLPDPKCRRDVVWIQPFASSSAKEWPLTRYVQLARALLACVEVAWLIPPDRPLPPNLPGDARKVSDFRELAAELSGASLFVGNDSGIAHLASAAGIPVVALFGPTDPGVWAPRGPAPTAVVRSQSGHMADIGVDRVVVAALALLGRASQADAPDEIRS